MRFDSSRTEPPDGGGQVLRRFPGPIASSETSPGGRPPQLTVESIDGEPWAVQLTYATDDDVCLIVRTVRSSAGLSPRGLTVEDIPTVMLNFLLEAQCASMSSGRRSAQDIDGQAAAVFASRAWLAGLTSTESSLVIDGHRFPAERTDVENCVGLHAKWSPMDVYCAVRPALLPGLRLRTADVGDFVRLL